MATRIARIKKFVQELAYACTHDYRVEQDKRIVVRNELWRWYRKMSAAYSIDNEWDRSMKLMSVFFELEQRIKELE